MRCSSSANDCWKRPARSYIEWHNGKSRTRTEYRDHAFKGYELNVTLTSGERVNVVDHADAEVIREEAYSLAALARSRCLGHLAPGAVKVSDLQLAPLRSQVIPLKILVVEEAVVLNEVLASHHKIGEAPLSVAERMVPVYWYGKTKV